MSIAAKLKLAPPAFSAVAMVSLVVVSWFAIVGASPASAQSAWWHLTSTSAPSYLAPGDEGEIIVTAANLGDTSADGKASLISIADKLPAGLQVVSMTGRTDSSIEGAQVGCQVKSLTCTYAGSLPPYAQIDIAIVVKVEEDAASGELNGVSVSGGQASGASITRPITVSEESVPFGLQSNELFPAEESGTPDTQAGSHPFQLTSTIVLNQNLEQSEGKGLQVPAALAKNISLKLPPGLVGNPSPFPRCTQTQFLTDLHGEENACPANTVVGVAEVSLQFLVLGRSVHYLTVPVFNLEPNFGEPARFGFFVGEGNTPVLLDTAVRSGNGEDYGITVSSLNTSQTVDFLSSEITFWGVPDDPRHDNVRGWGCLQDAFTGKTGKSCLPLNDQDPQSLLTLPTSCSDAPLVSSTELDSWAEPLAFSDVPVTTSMPTLDGCNRVGFNPSFEAEATTDRASAPSGLNVNINFHDEGLTSAEGLAESQLENTTVTLPEGLTINPSAGVGLGGCTPEDYARESVESLPGAGCPNNSKLGTVEIETPLLTQKIHGSLYIAQPYDNPFGSLVALYVVARNPEVGVLVKLAGKVTPNPATGQLTTTFEGSPQLPFSHFNFHFREGQQAPLISPATCGTYTTGAQLAPWSDPLAIVTDSSTFTITNGYDGGACPAGNVPPFKPGIESGTINNNAGNFSSFYLHLTRGDADQEISGFSTNLPNGLTGDLSGIPFCSEADIALARTKTGAQEEAEPSCPASSEIGHTLVGTGVGAVLAYVPGKLYLAGPFHGAPFSLVSVTSAVVGPFDLGTVVLRFGLTINPYTARVSVTPTSSEPIPTILDGIVTHVRDIRVYVDRSNFILNPTSCNPMNISSTLTSSLGATATVSSPFQTASCANLKFAPKLTVSTSGKTSRANGASLAVKLTYPTLTPGTQANIAKVKVDLPRQLPSELKTLQHACTSAQFEANPAGCPAASIVGHAKAVTPLIPVPLEGPAYFVSHGGEAFPSLIMVLQGYGVTIDLVGTTFINEKTGITSSTFKSVPDQPVGSFELKLPEGKYSALAANGNLCTSKLAMPTAFVAQNGVEIHESTPIAVTGCAKHQKKKKNKKAASHHKATTHGKKH